MRNKRQSLAEKLSLTTGLQLILVAGSLSFLSFTLGRQGAIQQKEAFRARIPVVQVSEQLSRKLSYPTIINQLNEAAIAADPELLTDFDRLSNRFWRQLHSFPVDYINFGGINGVFLGLEKTDTGEILHYEDSERFGRGQMTVFTMSSTGQRLAQDSTIPEMSETHEEAWYVDTVRAGKPTWSSIYAWEDQPDTFSISYNAPILDNNKQLLGVVGVDMIINQLSTWLQEAWTNNQGLALIVEANGDLVASSSPGLTLITEGDKVRRANIREINHDLADQFYQIYFPNRNGASENSLIKAPSNEPGLRKVNDSHFLFKSTPWGETYGLNWHLITAVPADREWEAGQRNQILFFVISLTALLLAVLMNRRLIRGLLTPLTALTSASLDTKQQISVGEADGENAAPLSYGCSLSGSSTREVLDLNQAIESMVEGFNRLTRTIRKKDEQALAAMAGKLRVSLEAASIAHEIKQPLSVVRLTSQSLNQLLNRSNSPALPPALSEGLNTLNQETERINTITEKMRALLRNAQIKREPVDLLQIIESSVRYMKSNRGQKDWIDEQSLSPWTDGEAVIQGDAVQLQLALINLLNNAFDALEQDQPSDKGNQAPSICVSLQSQGDQWVIAIDDNGPGLSSAAISDLTLMSSKPEGTGLGLFIVRSAAEAHGGGLVLSSSHLGGLRAVLNLPKTSPD